jgi:hypothetical protein
MRITSAGNVGIGTTSTGAPLTVLSDNSNAYTFNLLGRSADNASTINFFNNAGSTRYGYLYNDASGMYLGVNGATKLFINTSGYVGIGSTTSYLPGGSVQTALEITGSSYGTLYVNGNNATVRGLFSAENPDSNVKIGTLGSHAFVFLTTSAERMRITSGGLLAIGTTSALINESSIAANSNGNTCTFKTTLNGGNTILSWNSASGSQTQISFFTGTSYTTTSYNTSSDYRLKEDLKSYNGLEIVNKIDTYNYQWKADKSRAYGVIAHELQEVLPNAVLGIKDGEMMQQVDYSKIVPVLVQAIKELNAKLEAK